MTRARFTYFRAESTELPSGDWLPSCECGWKGKPEFLKKQAQRAAEKHRRDAHTPAMRQPTPAMVWDSKVQERYWKNVDVSAGCWLWTGTTNRPKDESGYGLMAVNGKTFAAHRLSWIMHNGPIPDGLCVLHSCNVSRCVNPSHLRAGTQIENIADRERAGRGYRPHQVMVDRIDALTAERDRYKEALGQAYKVALDVHVNMRWTNEQLLSQPFEELGRFREIARSALAAPEEE